MIERNENYKISHYSCTNCQRCFSREKKILGKILAAMTQSRQAESHVNSIFGYVPRFVDFVKGKKKRSCRNIYPSDTCFMAFKPTSLLRKNEWNVAWRERNPIIPFHKYSFSLVFSVSQSELCEPSKKNSRIAFWQFDRLIVIAIGFSLWIQFFFIIDNAVVIQNIWVFLFSFHSNQWTLTTYMLCWPTFDFVRILDTVMWRCHCYSL